MPPSEPALPGRRRWLAAGLSGVAGIALAACGGAPRRPAVCRPAARPPQRHPSLDAALWPAPAAADWHRQSLPAALEGALDATLRSLHASQGMVGVTAALGRPGLGLWTGTLGRADAQRGTPADPARFWWASVGKAWTATAVLRLEAAGRLELSAPVALWWPQVPEAGEITLQHLLLHTAGLPVHGRERGGDGPDESIAAAAARGLLFCPGTGWSYSNVGYMMLGRVVEQVAGAPLDEAFASLLLQPPGLTRTSVPMPGRPSTGLALPHIGGRARASDVPGLVQGAGPIVGPAEEMLRFWQAQLDGTLLERGRTQRRCAALHRMFDDPQLWYGEGQMLTEFTDRRGRTRRWLSHHGGMPGLNAVVAWDPLLQVHVAVALNSNVSAVATANALLDRFEQAASA